MKKLTYIFCDVVFRCNYLLHSITHHIYLTSNFKSTMRSVDIWFEGSTLSPSLYRLHTVTQGKSTPCHFMWSISNRNFAFLPVHAIRLPNAAFYVCVHMVLWMDTVMSLMVKSPEYMYLPLAH